MISVPNSEPKTVSFTQEVVNQTAEIAKSQITKMALAETAARGEKESADFVLAKATETLKSAEIAYRESISKSAWNKDDIRKAYNTAIAAYREADRRQQVAAEAFTLAKEALAGTRASANGEIIKGEFSDDKRQELAAKGKALGAEDALPESWRAAPSLSTAVPANKSIFRKDSSMDYPIDPSMGIPMTDGETDADASTPYDTVLCPNCLGFDGNEGCPHCDGVAYIAIMKQVSTPNPFSTDELLTRPFQKSEAYQNYIMKGGAGSGAKPGHSFEGNQHTGAMRAFSRGEMAGKKEGWKQTIKRYQDAHDTHMANGRKAVADSKAMSAAGNHRGAADKMEEAAGHLQKAHGALKGIQMIHQRELDKGSMGASQAIADAHGQAARDLKAGEYGTAMSEVGRLGGIADAADNAAYNAGA